VTTADEVRFAVVLIVEVLSVGLFIVLAWKASRWWLIGLVVALAINLPVVDWYDLPVAKFLVATAQCGHQPVIVSKFAAGYSYYLPGDAGYEPGLFIDQFVCSEEEAKAAGYHRLAFQ
jgi:hypothetical protein